MKKRIFALLAAVVLTVVCANVGNAEKQGLITTVPTGAVKVTSGYDVFSLENGTDKYVLLDYTNEGFYVASLSHIGAMKFDADNIAKFAPEDTNNIAYYLNNEYLLNGVDGVKMPQAIVRHLVEREWEVEGGVETSSFANDYKVKCKIALMSATEWKKYNSILGSYDDSSVANWFLRTSWGEGDNPTENDVLAVNSSGPTIINIKAENTSGIRPVFYLDKDFFLDERLNLNEIGVNVRKKITEIYSDTDLLSLYTTSEVTALSSEVPPTAYDVWMVGYRNVGDTVTGYYKYQQDDGVPESGTVVRWVRSDELGGKTTVIPGTTGKFTYKFTEADAGKYVYFEVTPATANTVGESYLSITDAGATVGAAAKPIVKEIEYFGEPYVGEEIGVTYVYYDENRELEEGTTFQWQRKTGNSYVNIAGATDKYYTVTEADADKELRICITPKNEGRYRLAPPYNDGAKKVGDSHYSEPIKAVALPKANDVKVNRTTMDFNTVVDGDKVSFSVKKDYNQRVGKTLNGAYTYYDLLNKAENGTVVYWEISNDGKNFLKIDAADEKEYTVRAGDAGKYIRFVVEVKNAAGVTGEKTCSEAMLIDDVEKVSETTDTATFTVTNKKEVTVFAEGLENAYAISFDLEAKGATVTGVNGIGYKAYRSGSNPVNCVLTKVGEIADNEANKALVTITFKSAYTGEIKISNFVSAGLDATDKTANYQKLPAKINIE